MRFSPCEINHRSTVHSIYLRMSLGLRVKKTSRRVGEFPPRTPPRERREESSATPFACAGSRTVCFGPIGTETEPLKTLRFFEKKKKKNRSEP